MENLAQKADFLRSEYTEILRNLDENAPRKWGKMDVRQMIEHMADYVRIANGRTPVEIITEEEKLPRLQGFLMSEKPFPENTPNVLMPETPPVHRLGSKADAIEELQGEMDHFFATYETNPGMKLKSPFFGELDFDMQVQLLHKHGMHHLKQFGAE